MVVYVQILLKLPVVFAEIRPPKPKKLNQNRARFRFGVRFRFGFGAYVKALIGFKAFYFFGSVSVRFRCVCEMALVKPLYKNKGDQTLPENYRPITILSCMGKLFTAILNTRLNNFLEVTVYSMRLSVAFVHHTLHQTTHLSYMLL